MGSQENQVKIETIRDVARCEGFQGSDRKDIRYFDINVESKVKRKGKGKQL